MKKIKKSCETCKYKIDTPCVKCINGETYSWWKPVKKEKSMVVCISKVENGYHVNYSSELFTYFEKQVEKIGDTRKFKIVEIK